MEMGTDGQMRSMEEMLNPRSIAVVGATPKGGYGKRLLTAVMKSRDRVRVYPVNPNYEEIMGVRAYPRIDDLPEAPDLVSVVVPCDKVLQALQASHKKGTRAAIVVSAGFAERGTETGFRLQQELAAFAAESGLRVCGPNCLGFANVKDNIWATATSAMVEGSAGHIGLICQSGATAFGPFLVRAMDHGIGFSYIISTGNEADLDFTDYARYLIEDKATRVIAGFVEGFKDAKKFIAVAKLAAEREKPLVLIKIGRSAAGARAASSHTAALTGSDAAYEAVFRQYGVIRVQDYDELLETSHLLAHSRKPAQRGVAVVSHSGGIGSLTADLCGQAGLGLPPLTDRARDGLNGLLKGFGSAGNPSDVTSLARSDSFPEIMDYLIEEPEVGVLVVASRGAANQAQQVIGLHERSSKGVVFLWTGSHADKAGLAALKSAHVPIFYSPEKLARGLKSFIEYHGWRDRRRDGGPAAVPPLTSGQEQTRAWLRDLGRATLSETESKRAIAAWGIRGTKELPARSPDDAAEAAQRIGYPVALKIDSPDVLHKTEAKGVFLGLKDADQVRSAHREIMTNAAVHVPNAVVSGTIVQEMVTGGVEVIIGITYNAQTGPMLLFGSGGTMVEVYEDLALRHCPISRSEAISMVRDIKGERLLQEFRGRPATDIEALVETLVSVSHLAVHLDGQLAELDINPLIVLPAGHGVKAVDALMVLRMKT